jgi:hypothetical protein
VTESGTKADVDSLQTVIRKGFRDLKLLMAAKVIVVLSCALMFAIFFSNKLEATFAEARQMTSVQRAANEGIRVDVDHGPAAHAVPRLGAKSIQPYD